MLSLCEVQVMVSEQHAHFPYVNIALNSTATQSSDYHDRFSASRAVDGKRTGGLNKGSCSMTKSQAVNTWTLWLPGGRLGVKYGVRSVVIFNRKDCCGERLHGAEVWLEDELCGRIAHVEGKILYNIPCNSTGGRITVSQEKRALTLCEVEVYVQEQDSTPEPLINVAPAGRAYQTSTSLGGEASRAIDGLTLSHWKGDSCTLTRPANKTEWRVELEGWEVGVKYPVERVVVYNRADNKQERINNTAVWVGDFLCGTITYKEGENMYLVECGGRRGSTVSLTLDQGVLSVCEVQVVVKSRNIPHIPTYTNVALGREASQGHNSAKNAGRAVDGNTSGKIRSNSCTWSENSSSGDGNSGDGNSGDGTWWRVNLDQGTVVRSIVIVNRMDAFSQRIDGVQVMSPLK